MSQIPPASGSPYGPGPYGPGSNAPSMGVPAHAPYAPPGGPVNAPAPYGPGLPQATVKSTRGPVVLLTIGIIFVVAAVATLVLAINSVAGVANSLNEINGHGNSQVTLEENGHYGLYGDSSTECTVRNPDGGEVTVRTPSASIEINNHQMFGTFTATKAGEYTVTCNSLLDTPVYLGEGATAGGIFNSAAGIILAVLGLVIGVPMTIGGLIWLVVRRSNNRRAAAAQGAGIVGSALPGQPDPQAPSAYSAFGGQMVDPSAPTATVNPPNRDQFGQGGQGGGDPPGEAGGGRTGHEGLLRWGRADLYVDGLARGGSRAWAVPGAAPSAGWSQAGRHLGPGWPVAGPGPGACWSQAGCLLIPGRATDRASGGVAYDHASCSRRRPGATRARRTEGTGRRWCSRWSARSRLGRVASLRVTERQPLWSQGAGHGPRAGSLV